MDTFSLLRHLNEPTIKRTDLEQELHTALKESGIEFSDEEPMPGDEMEPMPGEIDSEPDLEYNAPELPIDDDELQDLVSWCEEECGDMDGEELADTLRDEISELDFEPEEADAIVDRVMTMLSRGGEEDIEGGEGDVEIELDIGEPPVSSEEEAY